MDISFNPDGSLKLPRGAAWRRQRYGQSSGSVEKPERCISCQRPIRHRGYCLQCNIKKKELLSGKEEYGEVAAKPKSIATFPHPSVRPSQQEMIEDIRSALAKRGHLVADAPTGLGKTIAALYPALEYAIKNQKTIFFLTSRLSQHRAAIDTLKLMKRFGNSFSTVDMVGKMHLCSQDVEGMPGSMFYNFCGAMVQDKKCDYYNNYKSEALANERNSLHAIMRQKGPLSSQETMSIASARFCTYEMLMDAAGSADVIIGDYFHLFGRGGAFLKRLGKEPGDCIIIIDEAHNLAARLREYLSSRISTYWCEAAVKEARDFEEDEAAGWLEAVIDAIHNLATKSLLEKKEMFVEKKSFVEGVEEAGGYDEIVSGLISIGKVVLEEKKASSIDRVAAFLNSWTGDDHGYARILSKERIRDKDTLVLQYNCLDPSLISAEIIKGSHSTILMSGTLSPTEMHRDLLGMEAERTTMKSYPSPFPENNRKNIIVTGITTQYKQRTPETFARIGDVVAKSAGAIRGNAAVFFPSYEVLNRVYATAKDLINKHVILERSEMSKEQRDKVKDDMRLHAGSGAVLFGVIGGSFSEGIDLPGELLNGVVIVGLPLERPSLSVQALVDYYEQRFHRGRNYGYVYPALIKAMQAAGRCIRSESDRGVIVFADERFLWKNYNSVFPKSWKFAVAEDPEKEIRAFFDAGG